MYTYVERERTKSLRIRRGYKGTKSVSGKGDLVLSDTGGGEGNRRKEEATRDEGDKISMKRASLAGEENGA